MLTPTHDGRLRVNNLLWMVDWCLRSCHSQGSRLGSAACKSGTCCSPVGSCCYHRLINRVFLYNKRHKISFSFCEFIYDNFCIMILHFLCDDKSKFRGWGKGQVGHPVWLCGSVTAAQLEVGRSTPDRVPLSLDAYDSRTSPFVLQHSFPGSTSPTLKKEFICTSQL